jgi:hypothetical protein
MTTSSDFNFRVFYDPATGTINGYEHSNTPSERAGQEYLDFDHAVEWLNRKVDLETGTIVELTPAARHEAQLPKDYEVAAAIRSELDATLETQFLDYPASAEERAQWLHYRIALRGRLSDLQLKRDPVAMVSAWPERPDGRDPIPHLRARLK